MTKQSKQKIRSKVGRRPSEREILKIMFSLVGSHVGMIGLPTWLNNRGNRFGLMPIANYANCWVIRGGCRTWLTPAYARKHYTKSAIAERVNNCDFYCTYLGRDVFDHRESDWAKRVVECERQLSLSIIDDIAAFAKKYSLAFPNKDQAESLIRNHREYGVFDGVDYSGRYL